MVGVVRIGRDAVIVVGAIVWLRLSCQIDSDKTLSLATLLLLPGHSGRTSGGGDRFGMTTDDRGEPRSVDGGAI